MFIRKITSENIKFISNRPLIFSLTGVLFFIPFMVWASGEQNGLSDIEASQNKLLQGFYIGQIGYLLISSLFFGQEFSNSALRTSLLSSPKRISFLLSKLLSLLFWTTIIFTISAISSVIVVHIITEADFSLKDLGILIPTYVSMVELCIIMSCIVIITRSTIASLAIMISMILGLGQLLMEYIKLAKFLPVMSAMNSFTIFNSSIYPSVNLGLICQGVWCIIFIVISYVLFTLRCVR